VSTYSFTHLSDGTLSRELAASIVRGRSHTAEQIALIAEFDARKLYLPAGYSSMYAYCVGELHLSEDEACRRIHGARAARMFPGIFSAVAEGRLHLTAVNLLAPHLTPATADELLAAAVHKGKAEILLLLARHFPRPDLPTRLEPVPPSGANTLPIETSGAATLELSAPARMEAPTSDGLSALARIDTPVARPRVAPLAPEHYGLQTTIGQRARDNLRRAQELGPTSDIPEILDQALELYVRLLEKRKFAATTRPCPGRSHANVERRYIPAEVRRAVWKRDGGRCTFVSGAGHRCEERKGVEFDHVVPFARGGQATVGGIRLRCRAHNQYGAECTFGAEFMRHKRDQARRATPEPKDVSCRPSSSQNTC